MPLTKDGELKEGKSRCDICGSVATRIMTDKSGREYALCDACHLGPDNAVKVSAEQAIEEK